MKVLAIRQVAAGDVLMCTPALAAYVTAEQVVAAIISLLKETSLKEAEFSPEVIGDGTNQVTHPIGSH